MAAPQFGQAAATALTLAAADPLFALLGAVVVGVDSGVLGAMFVNRPQVRGISVHVFFVPRAVRTPPRAESCLAIAAKRPVGERALRKKAVRSWYAGSPTRPPDVDRTQSVQADLGVRPT